jgi:hypothetical protein
MNKKSLGLIASLGVLALLLTAGETQAASGGNFRGGVHAARATARPLAAQSLRFHRRHAVASFWPAVDGSFYAPGYGEPVADATPPGSNDVHYTYTRDVPWDWAHRYPPAVAPSDRPYVSTCPAESVTVPGRNGGEHTVNVIRCY